MPPTTTAPLPRRGGWPARLRAWLAGVAAAAVVVTPLTAGATVFLPDGHALPAAPNRPVAGQGYHLASSDGGVFSLGWYRSSGSVAGQTQSGVTAIDATRNGNGYWLASRDGDVFAFGRAHYYGSLPQAGVTTGGVVAVTATPTGRGYWLADRNGGVFAFGDAGYHGSLPAAGVVTDAVVGMAATRTGEGYWLVARDGGTFAFGDAAYYGSLPTAGVSTTVVGMARTRTGDGYWLVDRNGGVFAFGDAGYYGSLHESGTMSTVAALASTPSGRGYWLFGRDGGVFAFGDAAFLGSLGGRQLGAPVVGAVAGRGYHRPAAPADVEKSLPPVAPQPPPPAPPAAPRRLPAGSSGHAPADADAGGRTGYDISYPQCDKTYPELPYAFGIVGVTRGRAFRHNPCLASQWRWARASGAAGVYINVNFPGPANELDLGATGPQPNCNGDLPCIAYNFGYNGARNALDYAAGQGVAPPLVWLDIETMNYWTHDRLLNAVVVRGAIDAVRHTGKEVGIYSTPYQWRTIAGDFAPGVPVWIAGAPNLAAAPGWCNRSFAGGPVVLVQTLPVQFDENYSCPGHGPIRRFFAT